MFRKVKMNKPALALAGVLAVAGALLSGSAAKAWGPDRVTFTMASPAPYVTFNSITDDPSWGDERGFTLVKDLGEFSSDSAALAKDTGAEASGQTGNKFDETATAANNHYYIIKTFVHNNAAANLNLTAKNVTVGAHLDTAASNSVVVQTDINASNCREDNKGTKGGDCWFWDEAYIKGDADGKSFKAEYVKGSAKYYNNVKSWDSGGFKLDDAIVGSKGTKVGYEQMDGNVQGCFQYSGYATILVKVTEQPSKFTFFKRSRLEGSGRDGWSYNIDDAKDARNATNTTKAKPGDTIEFQLGFINSGTDTMKQVVLQDTLAVSTANMLDGTRNAVDENTKASGSDSKLSNGGLDDQLQFVAGSSQLKNSNHKDGLMLKSDAWTTKGLNIGDYAGGANATLTYKMKVPAADKMTCGTHEFENVGLAITAEAGSKLSTSKVSVENNGANCGQHVEEQPSGAVNSNKPTPGAPAAGSMVAKAAVVSTVALGVCAVVLVAYILKRKED